VILDGPVVRSTNDQMAWSPTRRSGRAGALVVPTTAANLLGRPGSEALGRIQAWGNPPTPAAADARIVAQAQLATRPYWPSGAVSPEAVARARDVGGLRDQRAYAAPSAFGGRSLGELSVDAVGDFVADLGAGGSVPRAPPLESRCTVG
jgi:hypothetical protein